MGRLPSGCASRLCERRPRFRPRNWIVKFSWKSECQAVTHLYERRTSRPRPGPRAGPRPPKVATQARLRESVDEGLLDAGGALQYSAWPAACSAPRSAGRRRRRTAPSCRATAGGRPSCYGSTGAHQAMTRLMPYVQQLLDVARARRRNRAAARPAPPPLRDAALPEVLSQKSSFDSGCSAEGQRSSRAALLVAVRTAGYRFWPHSAFHGGDGVI